MLPRTERTLATIWSQKPPLTTRFASSSQDITLSIPIALKRQIITVVPENTTPTTLEITTRNSFFTRSLDQDLHLLDGLRRGRFIC